MDEPSHAEGIDIVLCPAHIPEAQAGLWCKHMFDNTTILIDPPTYGYATFEASHTQYNKPIAMSPHISENTFRDLIQISVVHICIRLSVRCRKQIEQGMQWSFSRIYLTDMCFKH